ncbi:MAG: TonB-dependent siderophore receptor [Sporomusaceae bacterium]|nr:TonB-dependent siderophore receptor [Sporomusaceae bacterium]
MKRKMSRIQKSLLCAVLGGSLFWHTPLQVYAEEAVEPATAATQSTEAESTSEPAAGEQPQIEIQTVEVTAQRMQDLPPAYAGGQVARGASLGVLGNKDFMDTPFSVTSYTAQTIEDQQASTLHDVIDNDPSVRLGTSTGHPNENFIIRGLEVNADSLAFNGISGLAPKYRVPVEFLERVEVLKGPSTFLYGGVNTSVGGAINLVPKRAGEEDVTNFTSSYTSESQFGGHLDIGRRFGENKEWGIRFNGVYADGDTETDGQSRERLLGSLALDYRSDRWRLSLDAFGSQESFDNGYISMYNLSDGYVKAPDGSTNAYKGIYGTSRSNGLLFKGEYDLRDNLTAYASYGQVSGRITGMSNGNHIKLTADGKAYRRDIFKQYIWSDTTAAELGLRGTHQTGSVEHQWIVNASRTVIDSANPFNRYASGNTEYTWPGAEVDLSNPNSVGDIFDSLAWPAKGKKTTETRLTSLLLADTLSFDEGKTQLTLGIRRQNVETQKFNGTTGAKLSSADAHYDSHANSPIVGLVIKPWGESVALYANYIEMLSPGKVVSGSYKNSAGISVPYKNDEAVLAPYKSKQHEVGAKWDSGAFAHTVSLFQITKANEFNDNGVLTYNGKQRSRGIEWNAFGQTAKNLRVLGGVTYLRGEVTHATANEGNTPYGIPKWMLNAGLEWDTPWDPDLTLSLQAIFTGTQYLNNANTSKLPSWVRYDIGARYKTTINTVPVTFRASVENVFNKNYWSGAFGDNMVTLGGPRTFKLSATMHL